MPSTDQTTVRGSPSASATLANRTSIAPAAEAQVLVSGPEQLISGIDLTLTVIPQAFVQPPEFDTEAMTSLVPTPKVLVSNTCTGTEGGPGGTVLVWTGTPLVVQTTTSGPPEESLTNTK